MSTDGYEQCRVGYRPPIVVGDSPPYGFYTEFPTFYDAIFIERSMFDVQQPKGRHKVLPLQNQP